MQTDAATSQKMAVVWGDANGATIDVAHISVISDIYTQYYTKYGPIVRATVYNIASDRIYPIADGAYSAKLYPVVAALFGKKCESSLNVTIGRSRDNQIVIMV